MCEALATHEVAFLSADVGLQIRYHLLRARACGRTGEFQGALEGAAQASELAAREGLVPEQVQALKMLGNSYMAVDEEAEALTLFRSAWRLARDHGLESAEAAVLNNLGVLHRGLGDREEATRCFERSRALHLAGDNTASALHPLHNLGLCQAEAQSWEEARNTFSEVVEGARAHRDPHHESLGLSGLALVAWKLGERETARAHFERCLALLKPLGDPLIELDVRGELAELHRDNGAWAEAADEFRRALGLARQHGARAAEARLQRQFAQLLAEREEFADAYQALDCAGRLEKALQDQRLSQQVANLRVLHETERSREEANDARARSEALDRALAWAQEERGRAEAASRFKSDLLEMAAHDLRNPISAMVGTLRLAADPEVVMDAELLAAAIRQGEDSLQSLNHLLDASAAENGAMRFEWKTLVFADAVRRAVESVATAARQKGQTIRQSAPAKPLLVRADRSRLHDMLVNLLSNAVKYSPLGATIEVTLEAQSLLARVSVKDTGPGIPPAEMDRLFERFQRLSNAVPTGGETSTGLGLYLVRQLAQAHGGRVWAESEGEGRGSTFFLEVPRARDA